MRLVVIDGQGGGMGRSLIEQARADFKDLEIIAVGTNALATGAMLRAGANAGATGESAVLYNCRRADVIMGPIGIALPYSILGEISPAMAEAVCLSEAKKILLPVSKCNVRIVGIMEKPMARYVEDAIAQLHALLEKAE
ncbi:MAG: DUF3842 domain-containing protein [Clostridiales bacterium]|uniref:Uncharacterized protein DUF3842 n=1 Tax=Harryflintia acetispora TaxID=1849041 RepID=A0A9X8Y8U1_9FIRM|nr:MULTISPECIES: DUF3842 family protein [Oscillospiraceae]PWM35413.1 MAG: DUF3842 domain-containing protein [Clostridiales bacterium]RGB69681.1 DUF3842 family protein [Harryflintia acetispora]TCL44504.1 uncharacterized protein DUF3842 [Harryflintia acetispora]